MPVFGDQRPRSASTSGSRAWISARPSQASGTPFAAARRSIAPSFSRPEAGLHVYARENVEFQE